MRVNNTLPAIWQRCAFASCLAPANNALGARMFSLLPVYFQEVGDTELTTDAAGNVYLQQFLNVIGWGFDYLKTQYDVAFNHLNDPMRIPLGDLVNLAGELGMPFQAELPSYIMRKAVANWAHICQLRGTPGGLSEHMTLLTGYPIDLQSGRNKMLEQDQAGPADPLPGQWTAYLSYNVGEHVLYGNYLYICIATGGEGTAPTGTTSSNTYWQAVLNLTDPGNVLANPNTVGGLNTWQALYPSLDAGGSYTTPAGTLVCSQGLQDPVTTTSFQKNAFSVFNQAGSTQDVMLRSVSQVTADRTGTNTAMTPDKLQAIKDGVPILRVNTSLNGWSSTKRYATNEIALYDNALYQALRASTGAIPPTMQPVNANPYFATTITPWTATNATVSQSSAQSYQGGQAMLLTPDGVHANPQALSESFNVIPGATYLSSAWVYISSAWPNTLMYVVWLDAFGATISTSNINVSVLATTWTQISEVITAPANAAKAFIALQLTGSPAGSVLSYWDEVMLVCAQTPEWARLSSDGRLRMMLSGYVEAPSSFVQVIPYVEWYDDGGSLITSNGQNRVVPRTATPGTAGGPPNLSFDSFTMGIGTYLNGRELDTNDQQWQSQLGLFAVSGFGSGSAYPASAGTRSMAWITGPASTWLGVTFASAPQAGQDAGIIFRAASTTSYWRAGMTGLYLITGGVASLQAAYGTACSPGDRLTVQLNGNNITVYRNGVQVATTTSAVNNTATLHGIVVENVSV